MEVAVVGEPEELDVEDGPAGLPSDHDMLHAIVEDFFGDAAQILEGVQVAVHEGFEGALFDELHVHGPRIAQDHDEGIDRTRGAVGIDDLEIAPVDLGLEGRLRLKSDIGDSCLLALDCLDGVLHGGVATPVPDAGELLEDP